MHGFNTSQSSRYVDSMLFYRADFADGVVVTCLSVKPPTKLIQSIQIVQTVAGTGLPKLSEARGLLVSSICHI